MNKYSKRALKTTATVGMSLAMVLSAAAPVMATMNADDGTMAVCNTQNTDCKALHFELTSILKDVDFAEVTMDSGEKIKINGTDRNVLRVIGAATGMDTYAGTLTDPTAYNLVRSWLKVTEDITSMMGVTTFATYTDANDAATLTDGFAFDLDVKLTSGAYSTAGSLTASKTDAVKDYKTMVKFADGNYFRLSSELQIKFDTVMSKIESAVEDFITPSDEVAAKFIEAWTKVLDADMSGKTTIGTTNTAITGLASDSATARLSSKSALQGRIDAIKDAPDYEQVKNDDGVIAIIDQYKELIANLTDTKDLFKTDSYKAYTKTKTDDADTTVLKFLTTVSTENDYTAGKYKVLSVAQAKDDAKSIAKYMDTEQFEILKDVKEEVLDVAFNFETKKVNNYYLDKGAFTTVITTAQEAELIKNFPGALFTVVDNETGDFGYDYVAKHMEALNVALAAVTTDIEKITPANIKSSDKAKLVAAEDALYELTATKGKYTNNLTDKEARTIRTADKKIENLRVAFDNLGTTDAPGWVDMGNGNWNYNNEDGTPAAYKWVAAGSDWYFVRDGKMARNTWLAANSTDWYYLGNDGKMATSVSVDGCWINSLGIYRK